MRRAAGIWPASAGPQARRSWARASCPCARAASPRGDPARPRWPSPGRPCRRCCARSRGRTGTCRGTARLAETAFGSPPDSHCAICSSRGSSADALMTCRLSGSMPSARSVRGPSRPSGLSPCARWKRRTARRVARPRTPSASMPSARWTATIVSLLSASPTRRAARARDRAGAAEQHAGRRRRMPSRVQRSVRRRLHRGGGTSCARAAQRASESQLACGVAARKRRRGPTRRHFCGIADSLVRLGAYGVSCRARAERALHRHTSSAGWWRFAPRPDPSGLSGSPAPGRTERPGFGSYVKQGA